MEVGSIIGIVALALLASFVQRVAGFGFGIVAMTALPFLLPSYGEATTLSGLLGGLTSLLTIATVFRHIPWRKLLPILLTFAVVSFFAVGVVSKVNGAALKHVLGGMLIAVSLYFFFLSGKIRLKPSLGVQIGMGAISGTTGGLFAMQGPPAIIYFLSATDDKTEYIALTQAYLLGSNIIMTIYRAGDGFFTRAVGLSAAFAVPAVLLGIWIGSKVVSKIKIGLLRKMVYCFLAVAGLLALLS